MKKILFVCHGNICRSPMAEFIFKYLCQGKYIVESRATSDEEIGNDMHYKTREQLDNHHIPYTKHYAKQINIDDYNSFDLIVCFDNNNYINLERMFKNTSKITKLLDRDIDDPWYTHDFDKTYEDILKGCKELLNSL